ncbi:MAG: hypothetical protein ACR2KD_06245 [Thermoleophilaceae bacterium]
MAKDSKSTGGTAVEVVARRVRSLNDEILEAARRGGEASLEAYESFLKTVADVQEAAGARSAEWVTSMARGQAAFTREVAEASPAAARRLGERISGAAGSAARKAREVPGVAATEGEVRGVGATEGDLPIARYDSLNATEIVKRLSRLSEPDLSKVDSYERKHQNRKTIHDKIASLGD